MYDLFYKMVRISFGCAVRESHQNLSEQRGPTGGLQAKAQLQEDCMQYLKGLQLCRHGQVTKE